MLLHPQKSLNKMNKLKLFTASLLTISLISSCSPVDIDFQKENLIQPEDFFASSYEKYGIYYFQEECPMCKYTLPFITDYLKKVHRNRDKYELKEIYFIDAYVTPLNKFNADAGFDIFLSDQIGVTDIKDVYTVGYPLLYIIENISDVNTIVDIKIGKAAVTEYIKTIW